MTFRGIKHSCIANNLIFYFFNLMFQNYLKKITFAVENSEVKRKHQYGEETTGRKSTDHFER